MRICKHYIPRSLAFLVIAESLMIFLSVSIGHAMRQFFSLQLIDFGNVSSSAVIIALITILTFYMGDLYEFGLHMRKGEMLIRIIICFLISAILFALVDLLIPSLNLSGQSYRLSFLIFFPGIALIRITYYWTISFNKEKVLILGAGDMACRIADDLGRNFSPIFEVQGLISEDLTNSLKLPTGARVLGDIKDLARIIKDMRPDVMVVALSERRGTFPYQEILDCKLRGIRVEDWPTFYEKLTGKIIIQDLRPSWLIFSDGFTRNMFTTVTKSIVDILLAIVGLCVSLPLILCIIILSKLDSVGPIFFRQERVGACGKVFTLFKFRTMVADAEKDTGPVWAEESDPRVTRLGRILRRTGMDEIPQMFNVLKGEMSFVGPRPERPHFVAELQKKIPYYPQRLVVKPGITGWAQVRYGYGSSIEDAIEKLQFDLYYIKNMSFFLDVLIILRTIHKMIFAKVALQDKGSIKPLATPGGKETEPTEPLKNEMIEAKLKS